MIHHWCLLFRHFDIPKYYCDDFPFATFPFGCSSSSGGVRVFLRETLLSLITMGWLFPTCFEGSEYNASNAWPIATVFVDDKQASMLNYELTNAKKCRIFAWELPTKANFFTPGKNDQCARLEGTAVEHWPIVFCSKACPRDCPSPFLAYPKKVDRGQFPSGQCDTRSKNFRNFSGTLIH